MNSDHRPENINILGVVYKVTYVDKPSDVDIYKRDSLWGQIDYWTRTIRIYDNGDRPGEDVWRTILHEVIHGIEEALHLESLQNAHNDMDVLALAIMDVMFRNGWFSNA